MLNTGKNTTENFIILDKEKKESIGNYAVRNIEYNIINMHLAPGDFISEKKISDVLKISRTPIRESFSKLEKAHLMEIYPQKGTMVSLIDIEIIEETRFLRSVLEKEIIKIACENHSEKDIKLLNENLNAYKKIIKTDKIYEMLKKDDEFHNILFKIANKEFTYDFLKDAMQHFNRARIFHLKEMDRKRTLLEHAEIIKAIKNSDTKKSSEIMDMHLTHVREDLKYLKEKYPKYFK